MSAKINDIKRGTWCPYCRKESERLGIDCAKELAHSKNGECLSNIYINCQMHLFWRYDKNHVWYNAFGLQLDIFYPHYGFAIEVQGQQHEKYIEFFHRSDPNNFIKQQAQDQLKKELCEENWIVLRYVWYYEDPYVVIPDIL
ncbi:hypothetical protein Glove_441g116 [Diversispora epigaea]|uniref:Restriction endonuclease n=1 Tax=Diversispora epigaea TaxID=1348612 RepID=A0A397GSG8_9GLOM|nr:hypothetical protein Glove_441g116 [Diversispora epigaea]